MSFDIYPLFVLPIFYSINSFKHEALKNIDEIRFIKAVFKKYYINNISTCNVTAVACNDKPRHNLTVHFPSALQSILTLICLWIYLLNAINFDIGAYVLFQLMTKNTVFFYFMQVECDPLTLSSGQNDTGQKRNMGRDWKADAWVYSRLPSPPSFTVHGFPP